MVDKTLYKRLALAKAEFPAILKDTKAYGYKYAKLEQVITCVEPCLHKHDIDVLQKIIDNKIETYIVDLLTNETILMCSNELQQVDLKGMNAYQVLGSGISYLRRYQLLTCLGLAQEDDDAAAYVPAKQPIQPVKQPIQPVKVNVTGKTLEELVQLFEIKKEALEEAIRYKCENVIDNKITASYDVMFNYLAGV